MFCLVLFLGTTILVVPVLFHHIATNSPTLMPCTLLNNSSHSLNSVLVVFDLNSLPQWLNCVLLASPLVSSCLLLWQTNNCSSIPERCIISITRARCTCTHIYRSLLPNSLGDIFGQLNRWSSQTHFHHYGHYGVAFDIIYIARCTLDTLTKPNQFDHKITLPFTWHRHIWNTKSPSNQARCNLSQSVYMYVRLHQLASVNRSFPIFDQFEIDNSNCLSPIKKMTRESLESGLVASIKANEPLFFGGGDSSQSNRNWFDLICIYSLPPTRLQ